MQSAGTGFQCPSEGAPRGFFFVVCLSCVCCVFFVDACVFHGALSYVNYDSQSRAYFGDILP